MIRLHPESKLKCILEVDGLPRGYDTCIPYCSIWIWFAALVHESSFLLMQIPGLRVMAKLIGSLPFMCETWTVFQFPALASAQPTALLVSGSEPADGISSSVFISVSLHCGIACKAVTGNAGIPWRGQSTSQLLHFQSSSLLMAWKKQQMKAWVFRFVPSTGETREKLQAFDAGQAQPGCYDHLRMKDLCFSVSLWFPIRKS